MPCELEQPNLTPRQRQDYHRLIRLLANRLVMRNRARKALAQQQAQQLVQVEVLDVQGQDNGSSQAEVLDMHRTKRPSKRHTERPAIKAARSIPDPLSQWINPSTSTNPTSARNKKRKEL